MCEYVRVAVVVCPRTDVPVVAGMVVRCPSRSLPQFATTWGHAIAEYFPKYAAADRVRGFFPVNVPYMLPVLPFADGSFYKVLNETVVLFR